MIYKIKKLAFSQITKSVGQTIPAILTQVCYASKHFLPLIGIQYE